MEETVTIPLKKYQRLLNIRKEVEAEFEGKFSWQKEEYNLIIKDMKSDIKALKEIAERAGYLDTGQIFVPGVEGSYYLVKPEEAHNAHAITNEISHLKRELEHKSKRLHDFYWEMDSLRRKEEVTDPPGKITSRIVIAVLIGWFLIYMLMSSLC